MDISHDKHASSLSDIDDTHRPNSTRASSISSNVVEPNDNNNSVQKWDHDVEEDMQEVRTKHVPIPCMMK